MSKQKPLWIKFRSNSERRWSGAGGGAGGVEEAAVPAGVRRRGPKPGNVQRDYN